MRPSIRFEVFRRDGFVCMCCVSKKGWVSRYFYGICWRTIKAEGEP
jgi:hypothetical protein